MDKEKLTELVYINLGRASMCWSEIPKGVFDSTKAAELGEEIMDAIEKYVEVQEEDKEPGWNNPLVGFLDWEEKYNKESEWQRRRRLDAMREAKKKQKEEEKVDPTIAATADFLNKEQSNFEEILEREMKAFAKKIGWGVKEETMEELLERYNNPETQKRLIGLRDKEQRKFKLDDSFKKALEEAVVSDTPVSTWMDEHKGKYDAILKSGMFFEWHPTWTGEWEKDKYAFCHDRKYKKLSPQDTPAIDTILEIEETDEEAAYRKGYMDGYDEGLYDGQYK
jgi:hypothetical protein